MSSMAVTVAATPRHSIVRASRSRGSACATVSANFHVAPGMPVTADIAVGRHAVLNYLLGRVLAVASEGMRESSGVRRTRGPCAA
jgi:hypothetical protein